MPTKTKDKSSNPGDPADKAEPSKKKRARKLSPADKDLLDRAVVAASTDNAVELQSLIPSLVERELLNYDRAGMLMQTLLLTALVSQRGTRSSHKSLSNFMGALGASQPGQSRDSNQSGARTTAVAVLIEAGADVEIPDFKKITPLMYAASYDLNMTKILLAAGANVAAVDTYNETALHHAAKSIMSDVRILQVLVEAGADVLAIDNARRTPLHKAAGIVSPEKIQFLIENGADLKACAAGELGDAFTCLQYAIEHNNFGSGEDRKKCSELLKH